MRSIETLYVHRSDRHGSDNNDNNSFSLDHETPLLRVTSRRTLEFALQSTGMPELHWPPRRINVRTLRTEMAESQRYIKRDILPAGNGEIVKAF